MNSILQLQYRLSTAETFEKKYPHYHPEDGKVHILWVGPCLNESGYYRMLLPALELNKTPTHCSLITDIHHWDFTKNFEDYDTPIDTRLIQWADYVVLPAVFTDITYIIQSMRAINPEVEFVMDIDVNYHQLPEYHPASGKMDKGRLDTLLHNITLVDILTAPNELLLKYYHRLLEHHPKAHYLFMEVYPNLLSNITTENIMQITTNQTGKVRIGLLADTSQADDVKTIEHALKAILEKYQDQIELILFGITPKVTGRNGLFREVPVTYEKSVPITDYLSRLNSLQIDIGLLPFADNPYNHSSRGIHRLLAFAALMIPVIAFPLEQFNGLLTEGENVLYAKTEEDWINKTGQLIGNAQLRKDMGQALFQTAWEQHSYVNSGNIHRLMNVFI